MQRFDGYLTLAALARAGQEAASLSRLTSKETSQLQGKILDCMVTCSSDRQLANLKGARALAGKFDRERVTALALGAIEREMTARAVGLCCAAAHSGLAGFLAGLEARGQGRQAPTVPGWQGVVEQLPKKPAAILQSTYTAALSDISQQAILAYREQEAFFAGGSLPTGGR